MSKRFACGLLLLAAIIVGLLSLIVFKLPWLAIGAFVVILITGAIFFFQSLED